MCYLPHMSGNDPGAGGWEGRRGSGNARRGDELSEAIEPGLLGLRHGAVVQEFLRHTERNPRARSGVS